MPYSPKTSFYRRRGTAMVLMIIMSVVLTGLVMTIAWNAGVQTQIASTTIHLDQANMAAESAGQWAVWQFKQNNIWRQSTLPSTLPTMTIGPNTFTYAVTCVDAITAATIDWPFSEGSGLTTADTSGNGNVGTLYGGASWTTAGEYGDAMNFDGLSGYVQDGNQSSANIVGSVTMAAWVKMNSADQDQKVGGNQDGISGGYKMSIYGLKAEFEVRDASNNPNLNRAVGGGTILVMNTWYHVTGVYNAQTNTISTYINGVLDRTLTGVENNAIASTTGNFVAGKEPWTVGGNTRYFNGTIDEVKVFNRALTAQEILALADATVHIHAVATLKTNPVSATPPTGTFDFQCSAPPPLAPVAPAITVGGNLTVNHESVSGNVQVSGSVTASSVSSVNGIFTYGTTYTDPHSYISVTLNGKASSATKNSSVTVPTINYSSIQSQAISTATGGSNQTFSFGYLANQINIIYVNGNVTNPTIDTSQSAGTLLINGNLTLSQNASFGASGFPAYIIVEGNVTQTGTLNLTGALYVKGNWSHIDSTVYGDVVVNGNITDNTVTGSTFVVGGIPWFDPRANTPATPQPLFYTDYEGSAP